jgi:hypothetical protein
MEIHIHVHHHNHDDEKMLSEIKSINTKIDKIMATEQEWLDVLNRIDVATTNIAEDIRSLKDQITGLGLPQEAEDRIKAILEAKAVQLEGIAADTENPVPPPPPPTV